MGHMVWGPTFGKPDAPPAVETIPDDTQPAETLPDETITARAKFIAKQTSVEAVPDEVMNAYEVGLSDEQRVRFKQHAIDILHPHKS